MYNRFFDIERNPFAMVPDPDCVHMTGQHADVVSGAVYGVLERKGCLLLTGEAGLGKTTALRAMIAMLAESQASSSLIIHPTLDASEFLELVLLNFGISPVPSSKAQRLRLLEDFLYSVASEGRVCVLIVDEAHKLSPDALEEIRLLGNLESGGHKLLQIVLAGQNELVERLNLPQLWQLKQRIAFRLVLVRLDRHGVEQYVRFRWKKAGGQALPFDQEALDGVALWSHGIPRVINAICDNALLVAFSETSHQVGVRHVTDACQDLDLPTPGLAKTARDAPREVLREVPREVPRETTEDRRPKAPAAERGKPLAAPPPAAVPAPVGLRKEAAVAAAIGRERSRGAQPRSWGDERPSLLKRWLGFSEEAEPKADPLSLKRHL